LGRTNKVKLLVDKDWASSSLWVPSRSGGWASCDHHSFDLPPNLLDRCDYLSEWFETYMPGSKNPEPDWIFFEAYKLALAIDLNRHFQSAAQIFVWHEGSVVEITGRYESMADSAPQPGAQADGSASGGPAA